MAETKPSSKNIKEILQSIDPDSFRAQLIQVSKQFKSSWVELGEHLTRVATEKLHEEWGYKKFEEYCRLEIKVKKSTAIKLTNAYFFVTQEEPNLFQGHDNEGLPDLDAVCVLQRAKEDNSISQEHYQALKEAAMEKGQSGTTLARKYKELATPETNEVVAPVSDKKAAQQVIASVHKLKKTLVVLEEVPDKFHSYISEMEEYLAELMAKAIQKPNQ